MELPFFEAFFLLGVESLTCVSVSMRPFLQNGDGLIWVLTGVNFPLVTVSESLTFFIALRGVMGFPFGIGFLRYGDGLSDLGGLVKTSSSCSEIFIFLVIFANQCD
jgi:hypothetical protein